MNLSIGFCQNCADWFKFLHLRSNIVCVNLFIFGVILFFLIPTLEWKQPSNRNENTTRIWNSNPADKSQKHWKLTMQIASSSTQHYLYSSTFLWSLFIQSPIMIKCNLYFIVFFIEKGQKRLLYDFLKILQTFKTL